MADEKRLIDANALKEKGFYDLGAEEEIVYVEDIDNAPTVDAVEVVHGRWKLYGNDDNCGCSYFCSNCHNSFDEDWFYVQGQYRQFNYCPNCGAKMDGERKDND